jgi:hypothetical protein
MTSIMPSSPSSIIPTASRSAIETGGNRFVDGERTVQRLRARAQDDDIARSNADRGSVGGDVGPALIDHADHADRRSDPGDVETIRALPARDLGADRVGKRGDLVERLGNRLDALLVEHQAIGHSGRRGEIDRIGGEHGRRVGAKLARHRLDRPAALRCRGVAQRLGRLARLAAHAFHRLADVGRDALPDVHACTITMSSR